MGLFVVSVSAAVIGCVLSLTISVWAAKTHDVLMAVYMILALWLMALPIWGGLSTSGKIPAPPAWFEKANPYVLVFAPYVNPGKVGVRTTHFSPGPCCYYRLRWLWSSSRGCGERSSAVSAGQSTRAGVFPSSSGCFLPGRARHSTVTPCCGASGIAIGPRRSAAASGPFC